MGLKLFSVSFLRYDGNMEGGTHIRRRFGISLAYPLGLGGERWDCDLGEGDVMVVVMTPGLYCSDRGKLGVL